MSDLRLAIRSLRSRPAFTLGVLLTLTLGIAAASSVFSLINWLTLRPLPAVANQNRLVILNFPRMSVSYPNLDDLRQRVRAVSGLAGSGSTAPLVVRIDDEQPHLVHGMLVSADYFSVLGVHPVKGRPFLPEEEARGPNDMVAVISDRAWRALLGADPDVIGRSLSVNGLRARVVGVAPPAFHGTELLGEADVWLPGSTVWAVAHVSGGSEPVVQGRAISIFSQLVARLAPGATPQQALSQVRAAVGALIGQYPKRMPGLSSRLRRSSRWTARPFWRATTCGAS